MDDWQASKRRSEVLLVTAVAIAIASAVLLFSSVLTKNTLFFYGLPFVGALVIIMFLSIRWTFVLLLLGRALMDPMLNKTKVGGGAGIGALLNLFVIFVVVLYFLRFHKNFKGYRYLVPWIVFVGVSFLSCFYSPMRADGFKLVLNLCTYVSIFSAPFFLVSTIADKKFWIKVLLFSSFLSVGYAALTLPMHKLYEGRLIGAFTHPNVLAFYLVFVVTLIFYILETGILKLNVPRRLLLWIYMMVVLALLVLTQTRGAWISCAGFIFLYGLFKEKKYLVFCLLAAALLAATPTVQSRLKDLGQGTGQRRSERLNSMSWRMKLWESSIPTILRRPILGSGFVSFEYYSAEFFTLGKKEMVHPHNVYLELLFDAGLAGLLSYLWIYWRILKDLFRKMRRASKLVSRELAIVVLYVIGYMVACVSDNVLVSLAFNWYFWFYVGLMMRSISLEET